MEEKTKAICSLCGEPMPAGEEMFKFHGYSCPCPTPTIFHATKREKCDHDWEYVDGNPSHCKKCGMSLMAHAFMECP